MPTSQNQYGQIFGQGVKYIKINRHDSGGLDQSSYLGQLTNLTINYDDLGPIQYNIVTTQEQDTYFVYGIQTKNQSTSSVNYSVLDYSLSASKSTGGPTVSDNDIRAIALYTSVNTDSQNSFSPSAGAYQFNQTPNIPLTVSASLNFTATGTNQDYNIVFANDEWFNKEDGSKYIETSGTITAGTTQDILLNGILTLDNNPIELDGFRIYYKKTNSGGTLKLNNVPYLRITQSITPNPATSSLTIFNPEFIDWDYNDYNVLLGNAERAQYSSYFMDVDYTSTYTTPVNFDLIISGTADKALVQDSNYNSQAWSNIRYNGVESNSPDFNQLTTNGGYGALPNVEQNKTYIAYFDGVGGTGPEVINQTAYFIRYIIDEQGNVVNPEPDTIALYNLLDSYESGKNALVRLISGDPTQNTNPNDDTLTGLHPITYVGRISPILITETGSGLQSYLPSMSFTDINVYGITNTPNYNFKATQTTQTINYNAAETKISFLNVTLPNSSSGGNYNTTTPSAYYFNSNTGDFSNRVKFDTGGTVRVTFRPQGGSSLFPDPNANIDISFRIKKNSDIIANYNLNVNLNNAQQINDTTYEMPWSLSTGYQLFNTTDTITVNVDSIPNSYVLSGGSFIVKNSYFQGLNEYPANSSTASGDYWTVGEYLTGNNVSVLTSSVDLFNWYGGQYIQDAPQSVYDFNFSQITLPWSTQVGDYIRIEYNPNKVFNITNVEVTDRVYLTVTPPIPSGSVLNHFVLYRCVNDGTYVVLDIKKQQAGNSFTGIIQPQYISQTLKNNYNTIIQDLTSKGLIS
jgi:hypothetical protein